jgi:hypothetical protein
MPDGGRVTQEDVFGEFGFRVRWSVLDHWADFTAWEIVGRLAGGRLAGSRGGSSQVGRQGDRRLVGTARVRWRKGLTC